MIRLSYFQRDQLFFLEMVNFSHLWTLIGEENLDLTINCSNGTIKTSKCYCACFGEELSILRDHSLIFESDIISMPDYSCDEVHFILKKFSVSKEQLQFSLNLDTATDNKIKGCLRSEIMTSIDSFSKRNSLNVKRKSRLSTIKEEESWSTGKNTSIQETHICHICGGIFGTSLKLARHRQCFLTAVFLLIFHKNYQRGLVLEKNELVFCFSEKRGGQTRA